LYDGGGKLLKEAEGEASNPAGVGPIHSVHVITRLIHQLDVPSVDIIAAGISGVGTWKIKETIANELRDQYDAQKVIVANDLIALRYANFPDQNAIIGIAGTGSSVWASDSDGTDRLLGGYGHAILEPCSGFSLVQQTVERLCMFFDMHPFAHHPLESKLGEPLKCRSMRNVAVALQYAPKSLVAGLCPIVVESAENGETVANGAIQEQVERFSNLVLAGKNQIGLPDDTPILLSGGVFLNSDWMFESVQRQIKSVWPNASVMRPAIIGHAAARHLIDVKELSNDVAVATTKNESSGPVLPSTERMDTHSQLDTLSAYEIVAAMGVHNHEAAQAVNKSATSIGEAIEAAAASFDSGGRLIYLGAGTSGRLGVLDASECPPTFGVSDWAVGIMAGGDRALRHSVEGAEDDPEQSIADLKALDPPANGNDYIIGITASGTAPYVLSALQYGKEVGAKTAIICCNPVPASRANVIISLSTGPEILPGSTRLKAGTATKMVLNMITTGAMALSNHIYEGYMVGMRPVNAKLRNRAIRIVSELTQLDSDEAERLLDDAEGCIKTAVVMNKRDIPQDEAKSLLDVHEGKLRDALES
jgi:N-acetylmuramic acid 6-phosphate etherase